MSDEAAILSAIAAHPDEDTPRLAYADWLDDHAADLPDPPAARIRAEFIRVQCEIKKLEDRTSTELQGYAALYRRQDAILTRHRRDLLGPLGDELTEIEMQRDVVFDRGFVTELKLEADRFIKHCDAIAALKPLPEFHVTYGRRSRTESFFRDGPHVDLVSVLHLETAGYDPGVIDPFIYSQSHWSRLRYLTLEGCTIEDQGLRELVQSTRFPFLTALDLSGNEISDEGVQSLVDSPLWPRLKHLVLGANPISNEGAFALADAPPTAIEYLNLRYTGITQPGQQRLLRRKGWKVDLF